MSIKFLVLEGGGGKWGKRWGKKGEKVGGKVGKSGGKFGGKSGGKSGAKRGEKVGKNVGECRFYFMGTQIFLIYGASFMVFVQASANEDDSKTLLALPAVKQAGDSN